MKMDQLIAFGGFFGSCVFRSPQKNYFFAVPRRCSFGQIFTMQLEPPKACDKLGQMDLKLKPEFVGHKIRRRPYQAPKEQAEEIERQIQECIDASLVKKVPTRTGPRCASSACHPC